MAKKAAAAALPLVRVWGCPRCTFTHTKLAAEKRPEPCPNDGTALVDRGVRRQLYGTARLAQGLIDARARLYEEFQDPFRAWEVYFLARSAGLDVPGWVSDYLDRVAGRMVAISIAIEEGQEERTLADALELGRGKRSVSWKRAALRRRRQYAVDVFTLVQTKGYTKSRAIDLVAQIHKRDPDKDRRGTIARAVKDITKHGWRLAGGRGGPSSWPAPSADVLQIRPRQSDRSK